MLINLTSNTEKLFILTLKPNIYNKRLFFWAGEWWRNKINGLSKVVSILYSYTFWPVGVSCEEMLILTAEEAIGIKMKIRCGIYLTIVCII